MQPVTGQFNIRVYSPKQKAWFPIADPSALPVLKGDLIQIEGEFTQPVHAYYLWLDSQGKIWPLYPWNPGDELVIEDYKIPPPPQIQQKQIRSPPGEAQGWRLDDNPGLETLLLLVRTRPLSPELSLASLLGPLPPTKANARGEFAQLSFQLQRQQDRPIHDVELNRGPEKKARESDEPLLRLMGKLRDEFDIIHAVRFDHGNK